jgi:hypothetical protein
MSCKKRRDVKLTVAGNVPRGPAQNRGAIFGDEASA